MQMATFIALVECREPPGYVASFPDFPGCEVAGASLDEVIARAREALAAHVQRLLETNQPISYPTAAEAVERGNALLLTAIDIPDDIGVARIELAIPALSLVRIDSF